MIKSVRLKNFKAFKDAEIPLERLTVLVGPNGSGKTTVLEAIHCLTQLTLMRRLDNLFSGRLAPSEMRMKGSRGSVQVVAEIANDDGDLSFDFKFNPREPERGSLTSWSFKLHTPTQSFSPVAVLERHGRALFVNGRGRNPVHGQKLQVDLMDSLYPADAVLLLRLEPASIATPANDEDGRAKLTEDGRGTSGVLREIALNQPDEFLIFQKGVKGVIPNLRGIRMAPTTIKKVERQIVSVGKRNEIIKATRSVGGHALILDFDQLAGVPAESASEGTLMVLGILAAMLSPTKPRLLLLDGIERGLHPKATGDLIRVIRELMDKDPELQIVATSHSPYLLDHLKYEEIRITTLADDGTARVGVLSDHPDFEQWKDVMRPGEFWSTVGEKWLVANGKPSHA